MLISITMAPTLVRLASTLGVAVTNATSADSKSSAPATSPADMIAVIIKYVLPSIASLVGVMGLCVALKNHRYSLLKDGHSVTCFFFLRRRSLAKMRAKRESTRSRHGELAKDIDRERQAFLDLELLELQHQYTKGRGGTETASISETISIDDNTTDDDTNPDRCCSDPGFQNQRIQALRLKLGVF
ncbi:hypothetical protein V8F06_005971 [Rhypophila decipiens]